MEQMRTQPRIAVYPGSFDPITNGHLDIIQRASRMFDKVVVAILDNPEKKGGLFETSERMKLVEKAVEGIPGIEIDCFYGLLVDFLKKNDYSLIIKGLRTTTDFEYEIQMAQLNSMMDSDIETIFLMTSNQYSCISSSYVRQIAAYGGDISSFVPARILDDIKNKFK